jgi:hypothetical protein
MLLGMSVSLCASLGRNVKILVNAKAVSVSISGEKCINGPINFERRVKASRPAINLPYRLRIE